MTSTMTQLDPLDCHLTCDHTSQKKAITQIACAGIHDLDQQRLRILRCTAQAMASSPGGLRFKAGTRPWLEGLPGGRLALVANCGQQSQREKPVLLTTVG